MGKSENKDEILWSDKKRVTFGLPWTFTTYFLTPKKIKIKSGLLFVEENEIDLYKITDKKIITGPIGRMCNYGSIVLYSKDTNNRVLTLKNIKNVDEVFKMLTDCIDEERDKYKIRGRDMYGGSYYSR